MRQPSIAMGSSTTEGRNDIRAIPRRQNIPGQKNAEFCGGHFDRSARLKMRGSAVPKAPGYARTSLSRQAERGGAAPLCGRVAPFRPQSPLFSPPHRAGGSASGAVRRRLGGRATAREGEAIPQSKRPSRRTLVDVRPLFWTRVVRECRVPSGGPCALNGLPAS